MNFFAQRSICLAGSAALLAAMVGCASPGQPRPPSLHLPEVVTGLSAERHGDSVVLRFQTPVKSTDGELLTVPVTASLCLAVGDGPCVATAGGKKTIAGPVEWVDMLPADLAAGTPRRLAYRVETFNARGRSAGASEAAIVAAGAAPLAVEGLRAEGSRGGIVLRWTPEAQTTGEVLVEREAVNAPAPVKKIAAPPRSSGGRKGHAVPVTKASVGLPGSIKESKEERIVWLHAASSGDSGGMVDGSAKADEEYRYTAVRSRSVTVDGRKLELRSAASAPVAITLHDVYPPAVPQGLLAAGFPKQGEEGIAVDLVWQPDTDSDLAGYNVYRQTDGAAAVKLNDKPVALPAFHDATAVHGMGYRYTVTAVDAKGNESAASVAAELAATP